MPVAERLGKLLGRRVVLAGDTVGSSVQAAVGALHPGGLVMLENLRFNAGETSKDDAERGLFARQLADLADAYMADGFGVVNRRQASVYDVALLLPHVAGYLVAAETKALGQLAGDTRRPYVVVLGGAKVADKLSVVSAFIGRADRILIGGALAFTFLAAVRGYLKKAQRGGTKIVLPADIVAAPGRAADAPHKVVPVNEIQPGWMGLDIGSVSARLFAARLAGAKTVLWNGPMGVFELALYAEGTRAVAQALIDSGAYTVIGGGDTTAAVRALGFADSAFGYLFTGGSASLKYLQGKSLPGLAVLQDHLGARA